MEETYRTLPSKDAGKPSEQLSDYFTEKALEKSETKSIEHMFKDSGTTFFKLHYYEKTKCFKLKDHNIDFPSNWFIFNNLSQAIKSQLSMILNVSEFDMSMLYQIMSKICDYDFRLYFTASTEGVYVSFARIEDVSFEKRLTQFINLEAKLRENKNTEVKDQEEKETDAATSAAA